MFTFYYCYWMHSGRLGICRHFCPGMAFVCFCWFLSIQLLNDFSSQLSRNIELYPSFNAPNNPGAVIGRHLSMPQVSPASPDFFDFNNFSSFSLSLTFTLITSSFGLFIHSFLLYCLSSLQRCLLLILMGYPSPIHPTARAVLICDCSIITMSTTSSTYSPNPLLSPYTNSQLLTISDPGPQNQSVVSLVSNPSSTTTAPTPASMANLTSSPSSPAMPSIPVSRAPLPRGDIWYRF